MKFNFFLRSNSQKSLANDAQKEPASNSLGPKDAATERVNQRDTSSPRAHAYMTHALLLDSQKRSLGYRLAWCAVAGSDQANAANAANVADVAKHFNAAKVGWSLGQNVLFFDVTAQSLTLSALQLLPPQNVVLCIGLGDLTDAQIRPTLVTLRAQGFGFMLCHAQALPLEPELRSLVTHFDVAKGDSTLVARIRREQAQGSPMGQRPLQLIATRVATWEGFEACAARRVDAFVNGACASLPTKKFVHSWQAESLLIVRLMHMIRRDVDVREIEAAFKHDDNLTERLLRHINSPAIGLGAEIRSLRHAVAMLGYAPLFRWLSLLLATSNTKVCSPFVMKQAIMRGRFVELMGQGILTRASDSDELFVVGMFSLIDQLLGVSLQEVLARVPLSEQVHHALLTRGGVFGPFLALAETCETDGRHAARLSAALSLDASRVNAAHLSAMVWSQDMN